MLACIAFLILAEGSKLVDLRFGHNFGQVFNDYSGNSLTAVNGETSSSNSYDTKSTDKGAYFSSCDTRIKLAPNDKTSTALSLGTTFTIATWVLLTSEADAVILYRYYSTMTSKYFYLMRISGKLVIRFVTLLIDTNLVLSSSSTAIGKDYLDQWVFIEVKVELLIMTVWVNGLTISTQLNVLNYIETNSPYLTYIGIASSSVCSMVGFVWSLTIFDIGIVESLYIGGSYLGGNCVVNSCPATCTVSYISNAFQYCLPSGTVYNKNSLGNSCPSTCVNGCYQGICLDCSCASGSCVISGSSVTCFCEHVALSSGCDCPIGSYFNGYECVACSAECASCDQALVCLTCIAANAVPDTIIGCKCSNGFYGTNLITSGACFTCYSECSSCTQALICVTCVALHATPSATQGCVCDNSYFGTSLITSGSCVVCHSECATCVQSLLCVTCIALNAAPDVTQGCKCADGYFGTNLIASGSCTACYIECATCIQALICSSCIALNSAPDAIKGCKCVNGYFGTNLITSGSCVACYSECDTCTQNLICSTCIALNSSPDSIQGCKCDNGYFGVNLITSASCTACFPECAICNQALICTTCIALNSAPDAVQGCKCNNGYFGTNLITSGSCFVCFAECASCTQALICTTCLASNSAPDATQGCKCNFGYFGTNLITITSCIACFAECASCVQALICSTCITLNSSPDTTQGCKCNSGYFGTNLITSASCLNCFPECAACTQALICSSCIALNSVPDITQGCKCINGFFGTNLITSSSCVACFAECFTCTQSLICTSCIALNSVPDISQGCKCVSGYFGMNLIASNSCVACFSECASCTQSLICSACIALNSVPDATQGCKCIDGFYGTNLIASGSCLACFSECSKCSHPLICETCIAFNSIPDSIQGCVCANGYFGTNLLQSNSCTRCRTWCDTCVSFSNFICSAGFIRSSDNLCVNHCAFGEELVGSVCTRTNQIIFSYTFTVINNTYQYNQHLLFMGSAESFWPDYDSLDPWIIYQRGAYFRPAAITYGNYANPAGFYLGNTHCFDTFVFFIEDGVILTLNDGNSNVMQVELILGAFQVIYSIQYANILDKLIGTYTVERNKWVRITWALVFNDPILSMIAYLDKTQIFQHSAVNFQLIQATVPRFTIGSLSNKNSFVGYLYKISLNNYQIILNNLPVCGCSGCSDFGHCLVSCTPNQYWDNQCKHCLPSCISGCADNLTCQLHWDPNCKVYYNLTEPCVTCNPDSTKVLNLCVKCIRYLQDSDVNGYFTPDFMQLKLHFNVSIEPISCKDLFIQGVLSRFGEGYGCEFNSDMNSAIVTLGRNYAITNEKIELNSLLIRGNKAECGFLQSTIYVQLRYTTEPPVPIAIIKAPIGVSYQCQDLVINGVYSLGKVNSDVEYQWGLKLNDVEISKYSFNSIEQSKLLIKGQDLSQGLITARLSIKNKFNLTDTTEINIQSLNKSSLAIEFEKTDSFECRISRLCVFRISGIISCEAESFQITWSFIHPPKDLNKSQIQYFWDSQVWSKVIKIPPRFFSSQILSLSVYAVGMSSGISGLRNFNIIILPDKPEVIFSPSPGSVSLNSDIVIGASDSIDTSAINQSKFLWTCYYNNKECGFSYQKNSKFFILEKEFLRTQKFDVLTLLVSVNLALVGRIEQSVKNFTGKFVDFLVPNVTLAEYFTKQQPFFISSSRSFALNAEIQNPLNISYRMKWSINSTTNPFISVDNRELINIDTKYLTIGENYRLKFSIAQKNSPFSEFYYDFILNTPPKFGKFSVIPDSGSESSTLFTFTATDWLDQESNYPLSYNFGYKSKGFTIFFAIDSIQPFFMTALPFMQNSTEVFLRIYDSLGDYTEKTGTVNVNFNKNINLTNVLSTANETLSSQYPMYLPSAILMISSLVLNRDTKFKFESDFTFTPVEINYCAELLQNYTKLHIISSKPSKDLAMQVLSMLNVISQNPLLDNNKNLNNTIAVINLLFDYIGHTIDITEAYEHFKLLNALAPLSTQMMYNNTEGMALIFNYTDLIAEGMLKTLQENTSYSISHGSFTTDLFSIPTLSLNSYTIYSSDGSSAKVVFPSDMSDYLNSTYTMVELSHMQNPNISPLSAPTILSVNIYNKTSHLALNLTDSFITLTIPVKELITVVNITCFYFNRDSSKWDTKGCRVKGIISDAVICQCSHLSSFSAGEGDPNQKGFVPKNNLDSISDTDSLKNINSTSAIGFYFCAILLILYVIFGSFSHYLDIKDKNGNSKIMIEDKNNHRKNDPQTYGLIYAQNLRHKDSGEEMIFNSIEVVGEEVKEEETHKNKSHFVKTTSLDSISSGRISRQLGSRVNLSVDQVCVSRDTLKIDALVDDSPSKSNKHEETECSASLAHARHRHILIQNHKILSIFYVYSEEYSRFSRATILFANIIGNLFFLGLFYQQSVQSSAFSVENSIKSFGWRDVLVILYSTGIMIIIEEAIKRIFKKRKINTDTNEDVLKVMKINRLKFTAGMIISLAVIGLFCWGISLFALSLAEDLSYRWAFAAGIKIACDIFLFPFIISFFQSFVFDRVLMKVRTIVQRKSKIGIDKRDSYEVNT